VIRLLIATLEIFLYLFINLNAHPRDDPAGETQNALMKKAVIYLLFLLFLQQFLNAQQKPFLRVYSSGGKKISKGYLFDTTDTSIILSKGTNGKMFIETPVTEIDLIKTNRTVTKRVINTTLIVISVVGIIAVVIYSMTRNRCDENRNGLFRNNRGSNKTKNRDPNEISKPLHPLKRYVINSDLKIWQDQRILLNRLL
jgi:hypothetical protein